MTNIKKEELSEQANIFSVLPRKIGQDPTLSQSGKLLYAVITGLSNGEKGCFAGNEYLGKCVGIKPRRIQQILKELKERKLITIKEVGVQRFINIIFKIGR